MSWPHGGAASIWRRYVTDGMPGTGPNKPSKAEIADWGADVEDRVETIEGGFEATVEGIVDQINELAQSVGVSSGSPADRRVLPAGFQQGAFTYAHPGLFPALVLGSGPGQVVMSKTPTQFAFDKWGVPAYAECFVDPVNGDDGDAGTLAAPFATLAHALQAVTTPYVTLIPTGPFNPCTSVHGTHAGADVLKIVRPLPGTRATIRVNGAGFPSLQGGTWTLPGGYTYVYQYDLSALSGSAAPQRIVRTDLMNARGYPIAATKAASLAALEALAATTFAWFYDSGSKVLYINFFGLNVEAYKAKFKPFYLDTSGNSRMYIEAGNVLFRGAIDFEGVQIEASNQSTAIPQVYLHGDIFGAHPRIMFTPSYGCHSYGGIFYGSGYEVHASEFDCNNWNPSLTSNEPGLAVEHNGIFSWAGDTATFGTGEFQNRQASSAHGGANVIRAASAYIESWGQNIADTDLAGNTSYSWIVGCYTQRALGSGPNPGIGAYGTAGGNRVMNVDTCRTSEEYLTMCLYAEGAGALLKTYNNVLNAGVGSSTAAADGTISTYTPTAP